MRSPIATTMRSPATLLFLVLTITTVPSCTSTVVTTTPVPAAVPVWPPLSAPFPPAPVPLLSIAPPSAAPPIIAPSAKPPPPVTTPPVPAPAPLPPPPSAPPPPSVPPPTIAPPTAPPPPPSVQPPSIPPPPPPVTTPAAPVPVPPPSPPGWRPIQNTKDPLVSQIGRFAVLVHSLAYNVHLALVSVLSGSTQPSGAGYFYMLLLDVADGNGSVAKYRAIVWGSPNSPSELWKLSSFTRAG